jgi:2-phosphosulfolactate phosphatase
MVVRAVCEWGSEGARKYADHAALVVVDVLSFSTCVDVAVSRGATVYPFESGDLTAASKAAKALGADLAGPRGDTEYRYSLSPISLVSIPTGIKLLLPSPNGSAISAAAHSPVVLAGCLRNARAIAQRVAALAEGGAIAVIPAGEQWPDGSLRPAIEDLIGAGAILHELDADCSPEAEVAREAFRYSLPRLADIIRNCVSGRELIDRGFGEDVEAALSINTSRATPALTKGAYRDWPSA